MAGERFASAARTVAMVASRLYYLMLGIIPEMRSGGLVGQVAGGGKLDMWVQIDMWEQGHGL